LLCSIFRLSSHVFALMFLLGVYFGGSVVGVTLERQLDWLLCGAQSWAALFFLVCLGRTNYTSSLS
jgi:hypothetical protein